MSLALSDSFLYILVSSANILKVEEILEDISNKIEPKIVSCGTPGTLHNIKMSKFLEQQRVV